MKETHVLAAACSLALIAIVCVFIGYATDTLPMNTPRVITSSLPTPQKSVSKKSVSKKKDCPCCEEDFQKKLQEVISKSVEKKRLETDNNFQSRR